MVDKFSIRDTLVYSFLGFTVALFSFLHFDKIIVDIINKFKNYSDFSILLIIPFFYLLGHILMSIDDFIFNGILIKIFPYPKRGFGKFFNFLFFGYRNIGLMRQLEIDNDDFFKTCDKIIGNEIYKKAEYYQVMSDLFKGIFLLTIISCCLDVINFRIYFWKILLIILMWYRARSFSAYYVRIIKRNFETIIS